MDGACKIPIAAELMLPIDGARLSAIKSRGVTLNGEPFTSKSPRKRIDESTVGLEIGNPDLRRVMVAEDLGILVTAASGKSIDATELIFV